MEDAIDKAVEAFERGKLSRRDLVQGLTAIVAAAGAGGAAAAQGTGGGAGAGGGVARTAITQVPDMTQLAAAAPFRPTGINHISVLVSDLQRSAEFYAKIFSLKPVSEDTEWKILRLANDEGQILVSLRERTPYGAIDHYCFQTEGLNQQEATETFASYGIAAANHIEYGYYVVDPDGAIVQLV